MADTTFKFKEMLAYGQEQERKFIKIYKTHKLALSEDRRWDYLTPRGLKVELKSDTYDYTKTDNFFMEKYSDMAKKSPGGPWRAAEDGVDIWIYWFPKNKVYYEFRNLDELIKVLNEMTEKMYVIGIKNQAWITGGFKVPRDMLHKYYRRVTY